MKRPIVVQVSITLAAIAAGTAHLLWPAAAIDAITLTLLGVAILPWLAPLFRTVELPGGLKIEFSDLKKTEEKAEAIGLIAPPTASMDGPSTSASEIVSADPSLALVSLRIDIERRLRALAESRSLSVHRSGISQLLRVLRQAEVLTQQEQSVLGDLIPLLNSAAHGASVDPGAAEWAVRVGPRFIQSLDQRIGQPSVEALLDQWRKRDGAAVAEIGTQLTQAAIEYPEAFLAAMSNDPSSFSAWLDKLQYHTFTAYESRGGVHDELYDVFYKKMKLLLQQSMARARSTSRYAEAADRVLRKLDEIEVRFIE
jgi:hypothetical protein